MGFESGDTFDMGELRNNLPRKYERFSIRLVGFHSSKCFRHILTSLRTCRSCGFDDQSAGKMPTSCYYPIWYDRPSAFVIQERPVEVLFREIEVVRVHGRYPVPRGLEETGPPRCKEEEEVLGRGILEFLHVFAAGQAVASTVLPGALA